MLGFLLHNPLVERNFMTSTTDTPLQIEEIQKEGYHKILRIREPSVGLDAIICIHNTSMGPTLGGARMYPYANFEAALTDAMRLARGMTLKSAVAEVGFGGAKSVIIGNPKSDKTEALLEAYGMAVEFLKGEYICAEDSGISTTDLEIVRRTNPYLVGLAQDNSSGDPSPYTAYGVYRGMQACCKRVFGSEDLKGKVIAIQGLGSVGARLAEALFWSGAKLIVADIDQVKVQKAAKKYGAQVASVHDIHSVPCDIFAPCALGGGLNQETIPQLQCKIVAGCANNQLLEDKDGALLLERGILYAPDFVINAGGLINVSYELDKEGYIPQKSFHKVGKIYDQLMAVFDIASKNASSTHEAAFALAEHRLRYGIGKRTEPVYFHHADVTVYVN